MHKRGRRRETEAQGGEGGRVGPCQKQEEKPVW